MTLHFVGKCELHENQNTLPQMDVTEQLKRLSFARAQFMF
jgi:hypothetical protein